MILGLTVGFPNAGFLLGDLWLGLVGIWGLGVTGFEV